MALGDDVEESCHPPVGVGPACSFLAPEDQRELAVAGQGCVIARCAAQVVGISPA